MLLAALACPNLPLAPILAIEKEKWGGLVEDPASVYKPLENSSTADTTGCLIEAVQGQGAYQAALGGNGECVCAHAACVFD